MTHVSNGCCLLGAAHPPRTTTQDIRTKKNRGHGKSNAGFFFYSCPAPRRSALAVCIPHVAPLTSGFRVRRHWRETRLRRGAVVRRQDKGPRDPDSEAWRLGVAKGGLGNGRAFVMACRRTRSLGGGRRCLQVFVGPGHRSGHAPYVADDREEAQVFIPLFRGPGRARGKDMARVQQAKTTMGYLCTGHRAAGDAVRATRGLASQLIEEVARSHYLIMKALDFFFSSTIHYTSFTRSCLIHL